MKEVNADDSVPVNINWPSDQNSSDLTYIRQFEICKIKKSLKTVASIRVLLSQ